MTFRTASASETSETGWKHTTFLLDMTAPQYGIFGDKIQVPNAPDVYMLIKPVEELDDIYKAFASYPSPGHCVSFIDWINAKNNLGSAPVTKLQYMCSYFLNGRFPSSIRRLPAPYNVPMLNSHTRPGIAFCGTGVTTAEDGTCFDVSTNLLNDYIAYLRMRAAGSGQIETGINDFREFVAQDGYVRKLERKFGLTIREIERDTNAIENSLDDELRDPDVTVLMDTSGTHMPHSRIY